MTQPQNPNWGRFLGMGMNVAAGVGLGALIGWWIDNKYASTPKGMTIGAMIGLAGGLYLLIKEAIRMNKD